MPLRRGMLTKEIKDKSVELLGYEISQTELRFMPYLQYVMCNDQVIEPRKINAEEREILSKWRKAGYLEGGATQMRIQKKFWDVLCEILFLGYVDIDQ